MCLPCLRARSTSGGKGQGFELQPVSGSHVPEEEAHQILVALLGIDNAENPLWLRLTNARGQPATYAFSIFTKPSLICPTAIDDRPCATA